MNIFFVQIWINFELNFWRKFLHESYFWPWFMPSKCSIGLEFSKFFSKKIEKNKIHVNITSKCNILFWKKVLEFFLTKQIFRSAIIGNISGHDLCSKNGFGIQKSIENFFRPNRIQNFSEIVLDFFFAKILDKRHYWPRFMPSKIKFCLTIITNWIQKK